MKYIFEVTIKPGHTAEQYADAWVRASALIQQAPGAMGTELHRKIGEPDKLIAIARWASKVERDAMEARHNPEIEKIIKSAAPFVEIRSLGGYEEPEWVVLPPGGGSEQ